MIGDVDLLHSASMARSRRSSLDGGSGGRPSLDTLRSSEPPSPTAGGAPSSSMGPAATAALSSASSGQSSGGLFGSSVPTTTSGFFGGGPAPKDGGSPSPFRRLSMQGVFAPASPSSSGRGTGAMTLTPASTPTAPMDAPRRQTGAPEAAAYPLLSSLSKSLSRKMDTFR